MFLRYHCHEYRAQGRQGGRKPGGHGGGRPFVELEGLPDAPRVSGQVKRGLRGPGGFSRVKGEGFTISI